MKCRAQKGKPMKARGKSLLFVILILLVSVVAFAQSQYPVNPHPSGLQTTPYSNNYFSATFNGTVTTNSYRGDQSGNAKYTSANQNVSQTVTVRIVNYDIPANQASADFYADNDCTLRGTIENRSTGTWERHPFTYIGCKYIENNMEWFQRSRYIIVNSREAIFIQQVSRSSYNDQDEWLDFAYSLRIK